MHLSSCLLEPPLRSHHHGLNSYCAIAFSFLSIQTCAIPLLNYMHHCNQYSIRQFISCAYLFHQLRATRRHLARNTRICLYNPCVIVHLKSQKRQIFRYGGSNILGVYQNNSDFFQVCEQILLFYYFGSVTMHGHIAGKRKRPVAFASHPHTPGNREYNTAHLARHIAQGRRVAQHFHFHMGPPLSKPTPRPPPGWKKETRGRSSCSMKAKKFGVRRGSLIEQEHSVLVPLLPSLYS